MNFQDKDIDRLLSAIVISADDAILAKDLNGVILFWNKGAERLYGYTAEEMKGRSVAVLIPPERENEMATILSQIHQGKRIEHYDTIRVAKDGRRIDVSLTISPIHDDNGNIIAASAIARDITDRKKTDELIRSQLQEKNVLVQEIHHRVKNNLQIISSLLNMQIASMKDPVARVPLKESQNRIRAMALIHEMLYSSENFSRINFATYLSDLCKMLGMSYSNEHQRVHVSIDCEPISLDVSKAVPCGILVHEVLSNSFKHAFPDNRNGEVKVRGYTEDNQFVLELGDNGVGFRSDTDPKEETTLGMKLIHILARQLQAQMRIQSDNGTQYVLRIQNISSL